MIEFCGYSKSFGQEPVLQINNFCFERGIYWLRGKNGSGKSTLLKSMAALLSFDGDIIIHQKYLKKETRLCRSWVGFGYAEPVFPTFLTGRDMISFFQKTKGVVPGQLDMLSTALEAGYFLNQQIGTYSSGMIKKLSLILAFTGRPKWVLLDEPFNALDGQAVTALINMIQQLHRDQGVQLVLSSHPQSQAMLPAGLTQLEIRNGSLHHYGS